MRTIGPGHRKRPAGRLSAKVRLAEARPCTPLGIHAVKPKRLLPVSVWLAGSALAALTAVMPARADHERDDRHGRDELRYVAPDDLYRVEKRDRGGSRSPRDEAAERARRETGGRVLSVEERPARDDREGYRVKILTPEGEVRYYDVGPGHGRGRR